MARRSRLVSVVVFLALLVVACQPAPPRPAPAGAPGQAAPASSAAGPTRVSVGVTETAETVNPYGDSVALLYGIWCSVYGCPVSYDPQKDEYVGGLAERWEVPDP